MKMNRPEADNDTIPGKPAYDAIIIGAGMSGMYQLYKLRQLGLKVLVLEAGSGVGGTWYWNKYPGARLDSESWSYGFSFSQEVLDTWKWSENFASQEEIEKYCNLVADKLDLRTDIRFSSRVTAANFDEACNVWNFVLEDGTRFTSRYFVTAVGLLSAPTNPRFPGIEDFQGFSCHTGLWPREGVNFEGKRVAVIGTGASGIQVVQEIAKAAKKLTVFQRRPNWCTPLHNAPISDAEMQDIRSRYPEIFQLCNETAGCFIHTHDPRSTFDVSEEERNAFWEHLYAQPGFGIWQANFHDIHTDPEANRLLSEFVANKIRQRVHDPRVAEMLVPTDHGFGTRRVPQETGYYEVYNQDNVELIGVLDTPIERVAPTGIRTSERDFEFDIIVYATGFDGITGSFDRIDIRGRDGQRLKDKWKDGPSTFLGMMIEDFPNMFMVMGPHGALGNQPRSIEYNVGWISELISQMESKGLTSVSVSPEHVEAWHSFVRTKSEGLLSSEVDSWMTGVNQNVEGRQGRRLVRYSGTAPEYRARCDEVAARGYKELEFISSTSELSVPSIGDKIAEKTMIGD